jgi:hypothetical protein
MSRHTSFARFVVGLSATLLCGAVIAFGQPRTAQPDHDGPIEVDDPRPLASTVAMLEGRHGVLVTYEDPLYLFSGEIADVTDQVRRDGGKSSRRVLVPLGGPFQFAYEGADLRSAVGTSSVLRKLLRVYQDSGYPGVFRLSQTGDVFHVIPSIHRNALGNTEASSPLLDTTISLGLEEGTAFQMLEAIVEAVTIQTGMKVAVGTVPLNLLSRTRVQGTATKGTARTVLLDVLQATDRRLSWQLFCSPEPRVCALNVHAVERDAPQVKAGR